MKKPVRSAPADPAGWRLEASYARLSACLFARRAPIPVADPRPVLLNAPLAEALGLDPDALAGQAGTALLAGNALPPGSEPIAQAYAGHQFGHFTMLGDGRAIVLGEQIAPGGQRIDIQLKGSGHTPYSRQGDGRAALGPMLREYVISEAMHALGIPTTRSLAVVLTGEPVVRDEVLAGAVLTRTAASHIRVGTFEFAARCGLPVLAALSDYTIRRHFPEAAEAANPPLALLDAVADRQAKLVALWMHARRLSRDMPFTNQATPDTLFSLKCPPQSLASSGRHFAHGGTPRDLGRIRRR